MKMKKLLMTMAIIIAGCLFVGADKSKAATTEETIETNTVITDCLEEAGDVKYYWFTVDKSGYFNIDFSIVNPLDDAKNGWNISLYDDEGYSLKSYKGYTKSLNTCKWNYKKGTKMCVKIEANRSSIYYAPIDIDYKFEIVTAEDLTWEQEYNDTTSTATLLPAGIKKKGTLINSGDVDYYVYTMGKTGYFQLNFQKANVMDSVGNGWYVQLYDTAGKELATYAPDISMQSKRFNFAKGTKIYCRVKADSSNNAPVDIEYLISIQETAASNWEVETRQGSDATWSARIRGCATLKGTYTYGSLIYDYDNDIYKLVVSKDGKVSLRFNTNNVETNVGDGYRIAIYDSKGNWLDCYAEVKENIKWEFYAKKGTYYVEIDAEAAHEEFWIWTDGAPSPYDAYSISATSYQVKIPSMRKKTISYKVTKSWYSTTRTLKWKKVSNVDGYEVQLCKNKKFKNKKTTKLTSDTNSTNFSVDKGKYYVRVRAYRTTISGAKIYGKFTKVKKIRVK